MLIAEDHRYADEEYETTDEGFRSPTDDAWYRVRDAALVELRRLAAKGTLVSSGKGKALKIEAGSYWDWRGEAVPVSPEYGMDFEVLPDHREGDVARKNKDYLWMKELLDRGACNVELPLDMESPLRLEVPPNGFDVELVRLVARGLLVAVREHWMELQAVSRKIDEIQAEFDDQDPLRPRVRGYLDDATANLKTLHERLQAYTGLFELPEPDEETLGLVEKLVDRELGRR
jgi:hypothetical protein